MALKDHRGFSLLNLGTHAELLPLGAGMTQDYDAVEDLPPFMWSMDRIRWFEVTLRRRYRFDGHLKSST
jgi:hypothetical protein